MAESNLLQEFIHQIKGQKQLEADWLQDWCTRFLGAQTDHYRTTMLTVLHHADRTQTYLHALEAIARRLGKEATRLSDATAARQSVAQHFSATETTYGSIRDEVARGRRNDIEGPSHAYLLCVAASQACSDLLGRHGPAPQSAEDLAFALLMETGGPIVPKSAIAPPPSDTDLAALDATEHETTSGPATIPITTPVSKKTPAELAAQMLRDQKAQK